MHKMTLTFEYTTVGNETWRGHVLAEKSFDIKDEAAVQKDIVEWVRGCYDTIKPHINTRYFEVCRRHGPADGRIWVCYGTGTDNISWNFNFMSFAVMIMACTMNYLGWERDIDKDMNGKNGYEFVNDRLERVHFNSLIELDNFIKGKMKELSQEG